MPENVSEIYGAAQRFVDNLYNPAGMNFRNTRVVILDDDGTLVNLEREMKYYFDLQRIIRIDNFSDQSLFAKAVDHQMLAVAHFAHKLQLVVIMKSIRTELLDKLCSALVNRFNKLRGALDKLSNCVDLVVFRLIDNTEINPGNKSVFISDFAKSISQHFNKSDIIPSRTVVHIRYEKNNEDELCRKIFLIVGPGACLPENQSMLDLNNQGKVALFNGSDYPWTEVCLAKDDYSLVLIFMMMKKQLMNAAENYAVPTNIQNDLINLNSTVGKTAIFTEIASMKESGLSGDPTLLTQYIDDRAVNVAASAGYEKPNKNNNNYNNSVLNCLARLYVDSDIGIINSGTGHIQDPNSSETLLEWYSRDLVRKVPVDKFLCIMFEKAGIYSIPQTVSTSLVRDSLISCMDALIASTTDYWKKIIEKYKEKMNLGVVEAFLEKSFMRANTLTDYLDSKIAPLMIPTTLAVLENTFKNMVPINTFNDDYISKMVEDVTKSRPDEAFKINFSRESQTLAAGVVAPPPTYVNTSYVPISHHCHAVTITYNNETVNANVYDIDSATKDNGQQPLFII